MTLFGTDGVRGVANRDLTVDLAMDIAKATAQELGRPARVIIGRDTRISGEMLEAAMVAGLASGGTEVLLAGIVPTPALANLVARFEADAGVMISASHNPPQYNGIKLLDARGRKWDAKSEARIESIIRKKSSTASLPERIGQILHLEQESVLAYQEYLLGHFSGRVPENLHVVVDLGHGAALTTAPDILRNLGLEVTLIHESPEGLKINQGCGATHPEVVREKVLETGADLGLSFDGDADRLIAVDHQGQIVDGDGIMYVLAMGMKRRGELYGSAVVATVMSNLALEQGLAEQGIELIRTPVGDRWVAEALRSRRLILGGEQSGHIILSRWTETGDGLLTALGLMREMAIEDKRLADLIRPYKPYPQILHNVKLREPLEDWTQLPGLAEAVRNAEQDLGENGRVLIRPSGTEPLLRIMVEARDEAKTRHWVKRLTQVVRDGLKPVGAGR